MLDSWSKANLMKSSRIIRMNTEIDHFTWEGIKASIMNKNTIEEKSTLLTKGSQSQYLDIHDRIVSIWIQDKPILSWSKSKLQPYF